MCEYSIGTRRGLRGPLHSLAHWSLAVHVGTHRSAQRIEQGWAYGRERDVAKKQHPCLVPYEFLSESEKNYDREMSKQTLTLLIAMGFDVVHAQMAEEEEEEEEVRPSMRAIQSRSPKWRIRWTDRLTGCARMRTGSYRAPCGTV